MEGEIVEEQLVTSVDEDLLRSVAAGMCGVLDLPVPVYSAVKQGGTPLYKKARRGENVVLPIKPMEIHTFEIQNYACAGGRCRMEANIHVGSGTYVRSVVEEFGKRLGYPATVGELRRVSVGAYRVEDASDLDDTEALTKALRTYEEDSQK
jgi:tRNA pseudouridine55 synthase